MAVYNYQVLRNTRRESSNSVLSTLHGYRLTSLATIRRFEMPHLSLNVYFVNLELLVRTFFNFNQIPYVPKQDLILLPHLVFNSIQPSFSFSLFN